MDVKPIAIRNLEEVSEADLRRLITGYTSTERYRVSKSETEQHTELILDLENLDHPYHKVWVLTDDDLEHYSRLVTDGHCLAAYDASGIVGLALAEVRRWNRTFWIWEFHVAEGYRRWGIGRKLMDALDEKARKLSLRTMLVETQNTNVPAIRFYRSVGFSIEGVDLSYYTNYDMTDFEVAIFMKRKVE
jgi:streptothricin acetyltransferase